MADFRRRPQHELDRLSEQELVDYLDAARSAGDDAALTDAVSYLAFAFEGVIRARVAAKVAPQDIEDVTMEVLHSVIRTGFEGKLIAQFGALVRTITVRRIADHHRSRERVHAGEQESRGGERAGEDDRRGAEPAADDETGVVDLLDAVGRVLAELSELHRRVIRLYGPSVCGFENLTAAETCDRLAAEGENVSADNVAQIWSRFRRRLEEGLDG
jgi:DNA-directed RNA polymerase specialized sigma24 family protein